MKRCLNCMEEYEDSCGICPNCHYREDEESGENFVLRAGSILQGRYIVGTCRGIRDCGITYIGWDALFERKVLIQEFFPFRCVSREDGENLTVKSGMEELCHEGLGRYVHYHRNLIRLYREEDIISVFSCFKANQTAYATMQYSEAMTLGQWIGQDGWLDERDALAFLYQAVQAVKKVHDLGMIHGDIGMDDFWMTGTGRLVLKGFAEPCHYCGNPEQKDYRNVGTWIDVYGLCILFGEMLLGEYDVSEDDILDILDNDSIKLPARAIKAVRDGLDTDGNQRILSLDEFSDRIFGDSATMRLVNRADCSRKKGSYGADRKRILSHQDLLVGAAVAAIILVATIFFTMGRFTGTLSERQGHDEEMSWSGADGAAEIPGNVPADAEKPDNRMTDAGTQGTAGEETPAAGGETSAAGGETPAAGEETSAAGGETPAAGGETPAAGEETSAAAPSEEDQSTSGPGYVKKSTEPGNAMPDDSPEAFPTDSVEERVLKRIFDPTVVR